MAGSSGAITFDNTQKVAGVGSYKFDSEDSELSASTVASVLGGVTTGRRVSAYFRYGSVPDAIDMVTEFVVDGGVYSGGGFTFPDLSSDNGLYTTATPAKNAGQGNRWSMLSPLGIPSDAVIDSVKIIYERKYDVDTSIGISRVKWVIDGVEGPDHDNTDMPLTDTVVEVDVTGDRAWEAQYFSGGRFEVIAEARRGDTDTAHTQSWDYLKVEVQYHVATVILQGRNTVHLGFRVAITPKDDGAVIRFIDNDDNGYDGITRLAINEWNRISLAYVEQVENELAIKLYVNGIEELSLLADATNLNWPLHLDYGWVRIPGENHLCWFDQIAIDEGDDLTDIGNVLITAKLPASVNENNWDTTGGTGAVNERPLSETNYMQHTGGFTGLRQTYTLQTIDEGDIDLTGEALVGYMTWVWGKVGPGDVSEVYIVADDTDIFKPFTTTPTLERHAVTSTNYPSDAAAVGMVSNNDFADTFLYEGGSVVAYEGPSNPDILFPRQQVSNETLPTIIDDLRADPPAAYQVCWIVEPFGGLVTIDIYSLSADGGSLQQFPSIFSSGDSGRSTIVPGVEVQLVVTVTGVTMLTIWRRLLSN